MRTSKMRIYRNCCYSEHLVDLYVSEDMKDMAFLYISKGQEALRIPVEDVTAVLREKWAEANDELPEL